MTKMYQLRRFSFGNATSLAPSISGSDEVPENGRHSGNQDEEHHHHAVHGEQLL